MLTLHTPTSEPTEEKGDIVFYGTKDVARILGCSIPTAREIMQREDFPLVMVGRKLTVLKSALEQWASTRRV